MKRRLKAAAAAFAGAMVIGASGIAWYGFSAPPVKPASLDPELIDVASAEGQQLLAGTPARIDYGQLLPYFVSQSRRGFCGVATASMVVNAASGRQPLLTQGAFFGADLAGLRTNLAVTFRGMTLDELAQMMRSHGFQVRVFHADQSGSESFREAARATLAEPREFLIVNYERGRLNQEGPGHISPVGAYSAAADRLLVMDVAAYKYPHTWVTVEGLWSAMNTVDSASTKTRGYLLVRTASNGKTGIQ